MESFPLIALLALVTFGIVIAFALMSKRRTEEKLEDPTAPRSRLADDTPAE
ncbi:hypothetical protein AADZ90_019155 [Aestuariibius sp. 2305UL40-4]|uniref:hypothetical protein n=1 Tax=Aestuariibius violaceus TaxID=3234132 RepID=UPI00345EEF66